MKNCNGEVCQKEFLSECLCAISCENFGSESFCKCEVSNSAVPVYDLRSCDSYKDWSLSIKNSK